MKLNRATIIKVLRVATDVLPKLPQKGDSVLTLAVKLLGILDSAQVVTKSSGSGAALADFFEGLDATATSSERCSASSGRPTTTGSTSR